jgi:hypothetical protein
LLHIQFKIILSFSWVFYLLMHYLQSLQMFIFSSFFTCVFILLC